MGVPAFERGMGMSMPLAVPVLSGKLCGTCVSTAPALEHAVFSFSDGPVHGMTG